MYFFFNINIIYLIILIFKFLMNAEFENISRIVHTYKSLLEYTDANQVEYSFL